MLQRDANAKTPRANLFSSWSYWCKQRNEVIGNQADFYDALERKGFDQDKKRRFHGLLIPTKDELF